MNEALALNLAIYVLNFTCLILKVIDFLSNTFTYIFVVSHGIAGCCIIRGFIKIRINRKLGGKLVTTVLVNYLIYEWICYIL